MQLPVLLALALAACLLLYFYVYPVRQEILLPPVLGRYSDMFDLGEHSAQLKADMQAFMNLYQQSFLKDKCDVVGQMYALKRKMHKDFFSILRKMPNDLDKEEEVQRSMYNSMHLCKELIGDVRARCDLPFVINEPIDDFFYSKQLKPHNI